MFQMKLLRVFCSYSQQYIILPEAGTEIQASYVKAAPWDDINFRF